MLAEVKNVLLYEWEQKFPTIFQEGTISSKASCMAAWYHLLVTNGAYDVWLEPDWNLAHPGFEKESGLIMTRNHHLLKNFRPSFVLTEDHTIVGVGELLFNPGQHADFHPALSHLVLLDQLAPETSAELYLNPLDGRPDLSRRAAFASDFCLFLIVVGKKGGFAMDHHAVTTPIEESSVLDRFVHLTAEIGDNRVLFRGR